MRPFHASVTLVRTHTRVIRTKRVDPKRDLPCDCIRFRMPQIFCIIDEGGRTLVTKAQGDIGVPSFPTVGLLCSISTYSDSAGFSVETFGTTNVQIIYKKCVHCASLCELLTLVPTMRTEH